MLTKEFIKQILHYNPDTGIFTWTQRRSLRVLAGHTAGSLSRKDGYVRIFIKRKSYLAHRLAFLYMTGSLPNCEADHIDHDRSNNRWSNLRDASKTDNMRNISLKSNNTSGATGVCWRKDHQKWGAQLRVAGKNIHIGFFDDKAEAIIARKTTAANYGFHENHGT